MQTWGASVDEASAITHLRSSARQRVSTSTLRTRMDTDNASDANGNIAAEQQTQGKKRKTNRWNVFQKQQGSANVRNVGFDYRTVDDDVKTRLNRTCRLVDSQESKQHSSKKAHRLGTPRKNIKRQHQQAAQVHAIFQNQAADNAASSNAYEGGGRLMNVAKLSLANAKHKYIESVLMECKVRLKTSRQQRLAAEKDKHSVLKEWAVSYGSNLVSQLAHLQQIKPLISTATLHAEPSSTHTVPFILNCASHRHATCQFALPV